MTTLTMQGEKRLEVIQRVFEASCAAVSFGVNASGANARVRVFYFQTFFLFVSFIPHRRF